ncbi:fasciclin domain-containing protein [Mucilaginibacter sp. Bleaf8]|uniref:fasciclin domain-containing protein n=1 Tax=Mucilaginibacter sp. Bleaf8 TaxID=2834430 RepID=UPI001BCD35A3|nr:fasciclin domain-containing protein [Mucilaginibacter sp. Bleaf8]MBS7563156.1 fasciclin domain-containing protein [Mucilaginibacter sp. Bleaf8]
MKKLLLLLFALAGLQMAYAQNPATPRGSSYQDTVRSQTYVKNQEKMIDGTVMNSVMDIYENLSRSKKHTIMIECMRSATLVGTFKSRGPLTFFLPNDSAFLKKFTRSRLDTLLKPAHKYELANIITYHAVAGRYTAKDIGKQIKNGNGEASFLTLSGSKLIVRIDNNRNIVLYDETGSQSVVGQFDVIQNNGIIHGITTVLIPKDKAL